MSDRFKPRCRRCTGGITYFTVPERLVIQSTGELVGAPVHRAATTLERARGLLGTSSPPDGILLLERARQIHTFGMRYALDVVFCNAEYEVVHVVRDMKPGRVTKWVRRARLAFELASEARLVELSVGDELRLESY